MNPCLSTANMEKKSKLFFTHILSELTLIHVTITWISMIWKENPVLFNMMEYSPANTYNSCQCYWLGRIAGIISRTKNREGVFLQLSATAKWYFPWTNAAIVMSSWRNNLATDFFSFILTILTSQFTVLGLRALNKPDCLPHTGEPHRISWRQERNKGHNLS